MAQRRLGLGRLGWGLLAGVLVYAAMALGSDAGATWQAIVKVSAWAWAAALGLVLLNYGVRFLKWRRYLALLQLHVPWRPSLLIAWSGMVMSVTPGKLGELLKSELLWRYGGFERARTAPIVLAERVTDLLGLVVLVALGAWALPYGGLLMALCLGGISAGLGLLHSRRAVLAALGWLERQAARRPQTAGLEALAPRLRVAYEATHVLLSGWPLLWAVALSALSWGMEGVALAVLIAQVSGAWPALSDALGVYALGTLAGALSFLPGGLVAMEASLMGGLLAASLVQGAAQAAAVATLIRLCTLWFGVALGALAMAALARQLRDAPSPHALDPPP